jgi:hypothetical protein
MAAIPPASSACSAASRLSSTSTASYSWRRWPATPPLPSGTPAASTRFRSATSSCSSVPSSWSVLSNQAASLAATARWKMSTRTSSTPSRKGSATTPCCSAWPSVTAATITCGTSPAPACPWSGCGPCGRNATPGQLSKTPRGPEYALGGAYLLPASDAARLAPGLALPLTGELLPAPSFDLADPEESWQRRDLFFMPMRDQQGQPLGLHQPGGPARRPPARSQQRARP